MLGQPVAASVSHAPDVGFSLEFKTSLIIRQDHGRAESGGSSVWAWGKCENFQEHVSPTVIVNPSLWRGPEIRPENPGRYPSQGAGTLGPPKVPEEVHIPVTINVNPTRQE